MKILVCNAGSTSLKFKLYEMPALKILCSAKVERVGSEDAIFHYSHPASGTGILRENICVADYSAGIRMFLEEMLDAEHGAAAALSEINAVGFKTVLSKDFYGVHLLTPEVLEGMKAYYSVAPAHNGPYLAAIRDFSALLPAVPMVGVFETAFHRTIPQERRVYSIPYEWTQRYGIQKMGYHGASHSYIAERTGKKGRVISCHLGGSCSLCAIEDGKSVDNSFGFSLQCGIPHSNRCGEIDPFIIQYMMKQGLSAEEIFTQLSTNSGLKGVSGVSSDLRKVMEAADTGNERARLAVDIFVCEIIRTIGAYYAELGGLDQLVFTAGIGENVPRIREMVCSRLKHLGIILDNGANERNEMVISAPDSPVTVRVIPADEEAGVAVKTMECIEQAEKTDDK